MSQIITNGIIASPGIKIGKAYIFHKDKINIPKYCILPDGIDKELDRLNFAMEKTRSEISEIQDQIATGLSKDLADIFSSHLMVLEDPQIYQKAIDVIKDEKRNAEWVINDISMELIKSLSTIEDDYIRERILDISDIHKRIISNLQNIDRKSLAELKENVIVFSNDLTPSETAQMNREHVMAFVTDKGGKTSHTAIMARALEIPAIVGTIKGTEMVEDGDIVIVDAIHGQIIINPSEEEIEESRKYENDYLEMERELAELTNLPAQTLDSGEIFIYGNIEIPEEKKVIKDHGAQGIGLFRSEFLFLDNTLPDEERQFNEYKKVIEYFKPFPVTIRTIDVGGDKVNALTKMYKELNPFLGCRAIRFSFQHEDLFRIQIRAILRASHYGNAKLMFPMITTVEEMKKAREITKEIMAELDKKDIPYDKDIDIGLMIEVPSAAINADILSKYSDFFSIGTNDLVQYILAVDRISETVAYLYNPLNIAVLRFLKSIVDVSNKNSIPVSICGEMAGEPQYTMVLLGLGFKNLSMSPSYMHQVKKIIRSVTLQECEELVNTILQLESVTDIEKEVRERGKEIFKEILF